MKILEIQYVPLNENDEKLLHIEKMINSKRVMLLEKQKKLKNISKQNQFLEDIKNDYAKYYNYIYEQKEQQIKALHLLDNYINDLTNNGKLSRYNIEDAKQEQLKIIKEIKVIKHNLDLMLKDTRELSEDLNK
uniref:Uncharacterized protein n=1 Tax=viral metagenome TaxID=1070528 RepID=A0A6C0EV53_9ZZZZ